MMGTGLWGRTRRDQAATSAGANLRVELESDELLLRDRRRLVLRGMARDGDRVDYPENDARAQLLVLVREIILVVARESVLSVSHQPDDAPFSRPSKLASEGTRSAVNNAKPISVICPNFEEGRKLENIIRRREK